KLGVFLDTALIGTSFDEWFLCGPLAMIEELRAALLNHGVDGRHIHRELFYAGPAADTGRRASVAGETSTVTIVLDGRATSFELASDGPSNLDPALAVRRDAPSACKDRLRGPRRC